MNAVSIIPVGTVTFLFTDLEGSTRSWEQQGQAMSKALARHDAIVRQACAGNNGYVFKTLGDAFCVAFGAAHDALAAAIDLQLGLLAEDWQSMGMATPLSLRLALHTGPVETREGDYFGPTLNRTSRLLATAHGGQSLLSEATAVMVREHLLGNMALKGLGEHRLKDLQRPESVYQLVCPPLPVDFPPLRSLEGRPHNLPLQLTGFVGRETALADAATRLRDPGTRLLTLLGPGGTGKTRIALQLAAECLHDFADGAFFVALAPVRDTEHVGMAIASALGLKETGGGALAEYLASRNLLLVLDNFEQVVEAAPLVAELLRSARAIKIVVTSRENLRIPGEKVVPIAPLELPSLRPLPTLDRLVLFEAVRLFIDCAEAAKPDFAVTSANAPAVAEICHRLDGLPLAIELAAARIRMFDAESLLARLTRGVGATLTGGSRDLTARQQTLRGAIAWSVDLLNADERTLFARLGIFFGSFTYDAAEAVGSDDAGSGMVGDAGVLEAVEGLLDKSLLRRVEGSEGKPRVRMLETIREVATDEAQSRGLAPEARDRHLAHYMGLAQTCGPHLGGPDQLDFHDRLESDRDNLFHAMDWATSLPVEGHRASSGMRLFVAANQYWNMRTGFSWLVHPVTRLMLAIDPLIPGSTALSNPVSGIPDGLLARFRWAGVDMHRFDGITGWEVPVLEAALVTLRAAEDAKYTGWVLNRLSNYISGSGSDLSVAIELETEAAGLFRTIGDSYGEAEAVHRIGMNEMGRGNIVLGMEILYRSLATAQRQRDSASVSKSRWILACAELKVGNLDAAEAIVGQLIVDQTTYGVLGEFILIQTAIHRNDLAGAIAHGWTFHRRGGTYSSWYPGFALSLIGTIFRLTGDVETAEGHLRESERTLGKRPHLLCAQIARAKGDRFGARQDLRFALSEFSDDIFWSTMPGIILEVAGFAAPVDAPRASRLASLSRGLTARGERWPVYPQDIEQVRATLLDHRADPDLPFPDPMPGEAEVVAEALAALEILS